MVLNFFKHQRKLEIQFWESQSSTQSGFLEISNMKPKADYTAFGHRSEAFDPKKFCLNILSRVCTKLSCIPTLLDIIK